MRSSRQLIATLSLLGLPATLAAQTPSSAEARTVTATVAPRLRYSLDADWKFLPDGVNFAWSSAISDAGWQQVSLPHTWNAHDPFDDVESYRRGVSWYRHSLPLAGDVKDKRLFLYFEGVNQVADVYVNGAFVCEHRGGYTAFACDITPHVRFGSDNLLAVQVDNSHNPFIPPLSVGYALYGGIYRDVWLIATEPVHLSVTDHASPGVFVSTPVVSRESGVVAVRGTVVNDGGARTRVRVVNAVIDAAGRKVAEATSQLNLVAGGSADFRQTLPAVENPHLWSPDDPYLYRVTTSIYDGETLLDRTANPLGFRWYRFDPQRGFFLNGEKLVLRGTNRHQDFLGQGSALSDAQHQKDMELIKDMGANFVRLAHYPQDPAVLEAADRLGLLIWEEIPVVNYITADPRFTQTAEDMLRDMIRQHYNHPSVILWGLMNEVFLWGPEGKRIGRQTDTTYMRQVRDLAVAENRLVHAEDPTRLSTMAVHGGADYDIAGVSTITDVLGVNEYSGWYSGTFDGFGRTLDRRHEANPRQVVFVSEYGAENDERVNSLEPARFDFSNTWYRLFHESYLRQIRARPWLAGTAIWNEFDFSQPEVGGSIPYLNQKGMLTWDRRAKDVYYLYQANWTASPVVHIASHQWTERAGIGPATATGQAPVALLQPVDVYSNLASVELFLNGRSLGQKAPDDVRKASWDVPFLPGENVLEARGERDGHPFGDRVVVHFAYHAPDLKNAVVPFRSLGVNVGTRAQYADERGEVWLGDQPYQAGGFGYVGGDPKMFNKDIPITQTAEAPLYFTFREALTGYRFDVPDGEYRLRLLFAEPDALRPGERVFDVLLNGRTVLSHLDLAARGGRAAAVPVEIDGIAAGAGLVVEFRPVAGKPVLNAIHVKRR